MSTSHFSSISQLDAADIYGVIQLSRLEIEVKRESRVIKALKNCKKFFMNYFFCQKLFSNEIVHCHDDNDGSESINESEQQIPCSSASLTADNTAQNTPRIQAHEDGVNTKNLARGRRTFNSVSKVDKFSRLFFPLLYLAINLIYWVFYLLRSQRK